jgi:exopolysaccharide production protein ExoQ
LRDSQSLDGALIGGDIRMIPLATVVCLAFISWAMFQDIRKNAAEPISWAPFWWMFFAGSRFASSWLNLRAPGGSVDAYAEGSPVDRAVFFVLIAWGAIVLLRRRINWHDLFSENKLIVAYLAYCLLSILWTDEPTILAKRWIKDLGNPVIALVLLTEQRPFDALATTAKRLGLVLLPLSVLFIRYIPELGRGYGMGGGTMYTGAADQKNTLGLLCLLVALCSLWRFLYERARTDRYDLLNGAILLWLLYMANSKTAWTCALVGTAILVTSARRGMRARPMQLLYVTAVLAALYVIADPVLDLKEVVLRLLNRDETLTNRTELWDTVRTLQTNAIVGTGFMSFWAGDRMASVWKALGPGVNQAHNGYLEQYLNLGYVGVGFIIAIASAAIGSVRKLLRVAYSNAVLRLSFLVLALLYNYTEASFYGINCMWVLLLIASFDVSVPVEHQLVPAPASRPGYWKSAAGRGALRSAALRRPTKSRITNRTSHVPRYAGRRASGVDRSK